MPTTAEQGAPVNRIYPRTVPDLFAGEQLVLVGRYKPNGRAKVTLTGTLAGEPRSFDFPAEFTSEAADTSHAFVEKLWAMRRIGEIIDEIDLNGKNDELVQELVALSTKHGILTPYTSFLADETEPRTGCGSERLNAGRKGCGKPSDSSQKAVGGFRQREFKQSLAEQPSATPASWCS